MLKNGKYNSWCNAMLTRLTDRLSTVTGNETWIYSYNFETEQQSIIWVFKNEPNQNKSAACAKLDTRLLWHWRISYQTSWVVHDHFLPIVIGEFRKTNCKRSITLHHVNASSHCQADKRHFADDKNGTRKVSSKQLWLVILELLLASKN